MDICITPKKLYGNINAIPSKSQAHRMLICAAFSDQPTTLICPETNRDIEATANCLTALGAGITWLSNGYRVKPIEEVPFRASLPCQDSGSTLRFLLPIAGALGVDTVFQMTGRLPQRPLTPLGRKWNEWAVPLPAPQRTPFGVPAVFEAENTPSTEPFPVNLLPVFCLPSPFFPVRAVCRSLENWNPPPMYP